MIYFLITVGLFAALLGYCVYQTRTSYCAGCGCKLHSDVNYREGDKVWCSRECYDMHLLAYLDQNW